jgi:hypothetical protein
LTHSISKPSSSTSCHTSRSSAQDTCWGAAWTPKRIGCLVMDASLELSVTTHRATQFHHATDTPVTRPRAEGPSTRTAATSSTVNPRPWIKSGVSVNGSPCTSGDIQDSCNLAKSGHTNSAPSPRELVDHQGRAFSAATQTSCSSFPSFSARLAPYAPPLCPCKTLPRPTASSLPPLQCAAGFHR